jgi:hypothetical protein
MFLDIWPSYSANRSIHNNAAGVKPSIHSVQFVTSNVRKGSGPEVKHAIVESNEISRAKKRVMTELEAPDFNTQFGRKPESEE